jgi:hypothetical protein
MGSGVTIAQLIRFGKPLFSISLHPIFTPGFQYFHFFANVAVLVIYSRNTCNFMG